MREIDRRENHGLIFIYYDKVGFVRIGFGEGVEMGQGGGNFEINIKFN